MNRRGYVAVGVLLIAVLVWAVTHWQVRLSGVDVAPGGDFSLTSSQSNGVVTLSAGSISTFHLTADSSAGGHRIKRVAPGVDTNDAIVTGQTIDSDDFTGHMPWAILKKPVLGTVGVIPAQLILAKTCGPEVKVSSSSARVGMVPMAVSRNGLEPGAFLISRISSSGYVGIKPCAVATVTIGSHTVDVRTVQ